MLLQSFLLSQTFAVSETFFELSLTLCGAESQRVEVPRNRVEVCAGARPQATDALNGSSALAHLLQAATHCRAMDAGRSGECPDGVLFLVFEHAKDQGSRVSERAG